MNPDRNSQPQVSVPQEPCQSEAHSKLWNVKIFHPDGSVEEQQMDFAEVVQYAKANNIGFTVCPADRPH